MRYPQYIVYLHMAVSIYLKLKKKSSYREGYIAGHTVHINNINDNLFTGHMKIDNGTNVGWDVIRGENAALETSPVENHCYCCYIPTKWFQQSQNALLLL